MCTRFAASMGWKSIHKIFIDTLQWILNVRKEQCLSRVI